MIASKGSISRMLNGLDFIPKKLRENIEKSRFALTIARKYLSSRNQPGKPKSKSQISNSFTRQAHYSHFYGDQ